LQSGVEKYEKLRNSLKTHNSFCDIPFFTSVDKTEFHSMKIKLLCLAMVLSASMSAATAMTTQTSITAYQSNIKTKANYFSAGMSQEGRYIDLEPDTSSLSRKSKPKPKRYTFAKVVFYLVLATYCSYWLSVHQ
jgi:hypothetical protein